jgi:cell shape-determining protein MreC
MIMSYLSRNNSYHAVSTRITFGALAIIAVIIGRSLFVEPAHAVARVGSFWLTQPVGGYDAYLAALPQVTQQGTITVWHALPVQVGAYVFSPHQEFLGVVDTSLSDHVSVVSLISRPDREYPLRLVVDGVPTILESQGRGNGSLVVRIPSQAKVEIGSPVTTPSGVLLGSVIGVVSNRQDPTQKVFIAPQQSIVTMSGFVIE